MKKLNNTTKVIFRYIKITALAVLFGAGFLSCEIGLGAGVDLEAPVVTLTSHKDNDYVANSFRLGGTAYDNEGITKLSIDFEEAGLHFKYEDGIWQKKTASSSDWVSITSENASSSFSDKTMSWSVFVDTKEGIKSKDSNYNFSIIASDAMNNSGKDSKLECSLIVDTNLPSVLIYKPELHSTYSTASENIASYGLQDNNVISQLINGDFTISGRQENAISYRELRIEFDDGTADGVTSDVAITGTGNDSTTTASIAEAYPFSSTRTKVYYSKTLLPNSEGNTDLRSWILNVNQNDWITNEKNPELKTGKHLIRIISTSVSSSASYERKVLGFFVWWPEADTPWITMFNGSTDYNPDSASSAIAEVYPSSNITGVAFDDDGIKSLTYTLFKYKDDNTTSVLKGPEEISLPEENAKNASISITAPADNGRYFVKINLVDINGKSAEEAIRYFKVMDVTPPKIEVSPKDSSVFVSSDANGNITFSGKVTDDGYIKSLKMIYLDPRANKIPENIVRYQSGSETFWNQTGNATDVVTYHSVSYSNKLYDIPLGESVYDEKEKNRTYEFSKTFNLFSDLGISETIPLSAQYFIFRAIDNGDTSTVQQVTLSGDNEAPKLTLDSIQLFDSTDEPKNTADNWTNDNIPDLPPVKTSDYILLKGSWSDNSSTKWGISRIGKITVSYSGIDTTYQVNPKSDGTWEVKLTSPVPKESGVITLKLKDYGENETVIEKAVIIEANEAGIARVGCEDNDGSYKAGDTIRITLDFNKSTTVTGTPKLKLSNNAYAVYTSGSGTSKHVFNYTVGFNDDTDGNKLLVTEIYKNGAVWKDANSGTEIDVSTDSLPDNTSEASKTLASRNIIIDTTAPYIDSIRALTSAGSYKNGSQINFILEFNEDVTVSIPSGAGIKLAFKNESNVTVGESSAFGKVAGSKFMIFSYSVTTGNANPLKYESLDVTGTVTVTDNAGNINTVTGWNSETSFDGIKIDNKAPKKPTIVKSTDWNKYKTTEEITEDNADISFTVVGDTEDSDYPNMLIEYSTDNGSSWHTYTDKVTLSKNDTYNVKARQTDTAGNTSEEAGPYTVVIDRGDLLTNITSSTFSGTYKAGINIVGTIEFRKEVIIPSGSKVKLNVKNGTSNYKELPITGAGTKSSSFSFTYQVTDGDSIANNGYLDVTSLGFDSVKLVADGKDIAVTLPDENDEKRFKNQRQIKILTGKPEIDKNADNSLKVSFTGEGEAAKLEITYKNDRTISKNSSAGNITFTMDKRDFRLPTVLSESEFEELKNEISNLGDYYKEGVNGAYKSDTTLVNYTTKKYILDYKYTDKGDDETTSSVVEDALFKAFTDENSKHIVSIPMNSSAVKVDSSKLTVTLGKQYKLPVKGASYTLHIPEGAVQDSVGNLSKAYGTAENPKTVLAAGIEPPVIRVKKSAYTIGGITNEASGDYTKTATVTMPQTAEFRIDCRTPGAKIKYDTKIEETKDKLNVVNRSNTKYTTTSASVSIPSPTKDYPEKAKNDQNEDEDVYNIHLADDDKYKVDSYNNASGLKIAIVAEATKDGKSTDPVYEYATRTVLKLKIDGNYSGDGAGTKTDSDMPSGTTFKDLRVWVAGGDSPYGANSVTGFPLSWDDSSNFKMMAGVHTNTNDAANMYGEWWWVSWDISAPTYHGFYIGDVPYDVKTKGPYVWFAAECGWVPTKENYILYPGETLVMQVTNGLDPAFHFRPKNKAKRTR